MWIAQLTMFTQLSIILLSAGSLAFKVVRRHGAKLWVLGRGYVSQPNYGSRQHFKLQTPDWDAGLWPLNKLILCISHAHACTLAHESLHFSQHSIQIGCWKTDVWKGFKQLFKSNQIKSNIYREESLLTYKNPWLSINLSILFLKQFTVVHVTAESGSLFQISTTLCEKQYFLQSSLQLCL
jgi:hypothetical protein